MRELIIDEETVTNEGNTNRFDADLLHYWKKAGERRMRVYSIGVLLSGEEVELLEGESSRQVRIQTTSKDAYLKIGSLSIEGQKALAALALGEEVGYGEFILSFPEDRISYLVVLLSPDNGELVVTLSPAH